MRIPDSLTSLVDEGIIEDVLRPLMSGKEAQVFLVRAGGENRVAKVYKQAQNRSFKHRAQYTEGRTVRNSRDQRAMNTRTKHGRDQDEMAWRSAEVDMIYRLQAAGVRVPIPYNYFDGVLIMELVKDAEGNPAPRLGDLRVDAEGAKKIFDHLLAEVVRMLAAGVVHGDLSDFNVLMGEGGPVIIDFPQSINAAGNQSARRILIRDVENLHRFIAPYFPERQPPPFAQEMWLLYERGELLPDTRLSGHFRSSEKQANMTEVLGLIADANYDERKRREKLNLSVRGLPKNQVVAEQRRPIASDTASDAEAPVASPRRLVVHEVQQVRPNQKPRPNQNPRPNQSPQPKHGPGGNPHHAPAHRANGPMARSGDRPAGPHHDGHGGNRPAQPRHDGPSANRPTRDGAQAGPSQNAVNAAARKQRHRHRKGAEGGPGSPHASSAPRPQHAKSAHAAGPPAHRAKPAHGLATQAHQARPTQAPAKARHAEPRTTHRSPRNPSK
jgi:RIO kinase 1